jgi:hypothetical protein
MQNEKAVTWEEALEAGKQGKKIKVYGQNMTYPNFMPLKFAMHYLKVRPTYNKSLMEKEWYIENN